MSSLRSSRSEALLACFYSAVLKMVGLRTGNQSAVFNCSSHDHDHVQRHHRKQERCDNYGPEHPSTLSTSISRWRLIRILRTPPHGYLPQKSLSQRASGGRQKPSPEGQQCSTPERPSQESISKASRLKSVPCLRATVLSPFPVV